MIPRIDDAKNEYDETDNLKLTYDTTKRLKWYEYIILNKPLQVIVLLLLLAVAVPLLVYQFFYIPSGDYQLSVGSCQLAESSRLPCGPGTVPQDECHPECCYDVTINFCYHRLPSRFSYLMDWPWSEYMALYPRVSTVPYKSLMSLRNLHLSISEESDSHLTIHLYDPSKGLNIGKRLYKKLYSYRVSSPEMNIAVTGPQGVIFDTMHGPLIATNDGIWEITFRLTNDYMYGLGELPLKPGTEKILYNHDKSFGSVPLIFAHINGSYHGLLIDTKDPTEVIVGGDNDIIVRSLTTTGLKFHLFVGPTPKDVMKDSMKIIGAHKNLEYWMLGAHICGTSGHNLQDYITSLTSNNIPFESHCGQRPIVLPSDRCSEKEKGLIQAVIDGANLIRRAEKRFIPHISPYIRYIENHTTSVVSDCSVLPEFDLLMYHNPHNFQLYEGEINSDTDTVIYPAYEIASTHFLDRLWPFSIKFDGVVIENNWPLDQSNKSLHDPGSHLPYFNANFEEALRNTPKWNITLADGKDKYIFKHNTYGMESMKALMSVIGDHKFTSVTNQWYDGSVIVNRQHVDSLWSNLHKAILEAALGSVSGHWLWSSPICGDTAYFEPENQTELCLKWYMAATYFPIIKIDSNSIPRDPVAFYGNHRNNMIKALNRRLALQPYFFTVLQNGPLLRPMFYQFPKSTFLRNVNTQFSVGDDLLIVPNLQPFQSHVHIMMPPGTWYEFMGGEKINATEGEMATMTTLQSDFLTLIRAGSILVLHHETSMTAEKTRFESTSSIVVALDCDNSTNCTASGDFYVLPTISFHIEATHEKLFFRAIGNDFESICNWPNTPMDDMIHSVKVFGLERQYNNEDTYRSVNVNVFLCDLMSSDVIEADFI